MNDRTDHNRFADQLLARLRGEAAPIVTPAPVADHAPAGEAAPIAAEPRKPRRTVRVVEAVETAEIAVPPVEPPGTVERFIWPASTPLELITCEQNSPEWQRARLGIPTASAFDQIMTPGKKKAAETLPDGSFPIRTEDDLRCAIEALADTKKKATLKKHIIARAQVLKAVRLLPEDWGVEEKDADTEQKTRRTYMLKLAGEVLTGFPMDMPTTYDMKRGHIVEPEACDLYALETGTNLDAVGFIRRGRVGCSPDRLISTDGGLEIKTKLPHLLLDLIEKDEFPEEHKAQVQGALWITDRQWWDLEVVAIVEIDGQPTLAPNMPRFVKRAYRDEAYIAQLAAEVERFNTDLDAVVERMRQRMGQDNTFEFAAAAA